MPSTYHIDLSLLCTLDDKWFWALWCIFAFSTVFFIYKCYKSLLHAHAVSGTPTSKIRSAHQGYVELLGNQAYSPDGNLIGKLSKKPCTWYRYSIDHYNGKEWQRLEQGMSSQLFMINDGTGVCYIDPQGADISTPLCHHWYGKSRYPKKGVPEGFFARLFGSSGSYKYTEWRMDANMPLYALGNFVTLSERRIKNQNKTQAIDKLLKQWEKKHQHLLQTLLQQDIHPTHTDKKETLDYEAKKQLYRETLAKMDPTFHVLSQHGLDKRHPMILSAHGIKRLTRGYQWDAFIWGFAFVIDFALATWLLQFRFTC